MNRRMTPLVMYKGITHALSSMHNPENMRALFAHTSPPGLSPAEQEERWLRIAETFDDMPEEQAAVCLSNYHLFQERLKDLTARQVATVEAIHRVGSQAVLGGPPVTSVAGAASSMQGVALSALVERYLHLVDATSQYSSYSGACEGGGGGEDDAHAWEGARGEWPCRRLRHLAACTHTLALADATLRAVTDFMAATGNNVRASQKWRMTGRCVAAGAVVSGCTSAARAQPAVSSPAPPRMALAARSRLPPLLSGRGGYREGLAPAARAHPLYGRGERHG